MAGDARHPPLRDAPSIEITGHEVIQGDVDRFQFLLIFLIHGIFLALVWRLAGTNYFLFGLGFYGVVILSGLLIDGLWHDDAPEWIFTSLRWVFWGPLTASFIGGLVISLIALARRMIYALSV
jgi:hypothetical protein